MLVLRFLIHFEQMIYIKQTMNCESLAESLYFVWVYKFTLDRLKLKLATCNFLIIFLRVFKQIIGQKGLGEL